MWNINEQFLQQQIILGKKFVLTHNPYEATGFFSQKVEFSTKNRYDFLKTALFGIKINNL